MGFKKEKTKKGKQGFSEKASQETKPDSLSREGHSPWTKQCE